MVLSGVQVGDTDVQISASQAVLDWSTDSLSFTMEDAQAVNRVSERHLTSSIVFYSQDAITCVLSAAASGSHSAHCNHSLLSWALPACVMLDIHPAICMWAIDGLQYDESLYAWTIWCDKGD